MMYDALQRLGVTGEYGFVIAALYKFVDLPDYRDWRPVLQALCEAGGVRGTLLLADEGINGTICDRRDGMGRVLEWIEAEPRLDGLSLKFSGAPDQPFLRMKVRLKREIVTMGRPEISPARFTGTYVEPRDWNSLVDDPDVMVIDTRNVYETAIGTFDQAVDPQTDSFREFPEWAAQLAADPDRPKKLAMFCTGGIRCEKASALMQDMGFDEVYHLKGGILKYLEDVPQADSRWQGESVNIATTEFREGVAMKERWDFRRYPDYRESFRDYVSFLQDNPRYRAVWEVADQPEVFAERLQEAGYATDPAYGRKIRNIMEGEPFEAALNQFPTLSMVGEE